MALRHKPPPFVPLSIHLSIHPFPHVSQEAALPLTGSEQSELAQTAKQSVLDAKHTDQLQDTAIPLLLIRWASLHAAGPERGPGVVDCPG